MNPEPLNDENPSTILQKAEDVYSSIVGKKVDRVIQLIEKAGLNNNENLVRDILIDTQKGFDLKTARDMRVSQAITSHAMTFGMRVEIPSTIEEANYEAFQINDIERLYRLLQQYIAERFEEFRSIDAQRNPLLVEENQASLYDQFLEEEIKALQTKQQAHERAAAIAAAKMNGDPTPVFPEQPPLSEAEAKNLEMYIDARENGTIARPILARLWATPQYAKLTDLARNTYQDVHKVLTKLFDLHHFLDIMFHMHKSEQLLSIMKMVENTTIDFMDVPYLDFTEVAAAFRRAEIAMTNINGLFLSYMVKFKQAKAAGATKPPSLASTPVPPPPPKPPAPPAPNKSVLYISIDYVATYKEDDFANPEKKVNEIAAAVEKVCAARPAIFDEMWALAAKLRFDLRTFQFGNHVQYSLGDDALNASRVSVRNYFKELSRRSVAKRPRFFIQFDVILTNCLAGIELGNIIANLELLPGEIREMKERLSEITKTMMEESTAITDGMSASVKDSMEASVQNETATQHTYSTEMETYGEKNLRKKDSRTKEKSDSIDTEYKAGASIGGDTWNIGGGAERKAHTDTKVSTASETEATDKSGWKNKVNDATTDSNKVVATATNSHVAEVSTKRDQNLAKKFQQEFTKEMERTQSRTFRNQSGDGIVNYVFFSLVQKVNCFISIANPRLMLINQGAAPEPASLAEYDQFLGKFVDNKAAFIERIEGLLENIKDYKGRPFKLFNPSAEEMKSIGHLTYDALLARFNYADKLDLEDLLYRKFYPRIPGVITKAWQTSITSAAIHPVPIISEGALTPRQLELFDLKIATERLSTDKQKTYNELLEVGKDLLEEKGIDPQFAAQLLLILLSASKEQIMDSTGVIRYMFMNAGADSESLMFRMKNVLNDKK